MSYLARLRIEIYLETDDLRRPLSFVMEGSTLTVPAEAPYGSLAELDALLSNAKTALSGQARELAIKLEPQEVRT